jgi:hypothetical protein
MTQIAPFSLRLAERRVPSRTTHEEEAVSTRTHATIEDLYQVEGKAELVDGEIVLMSPTGGFQAGQREEFIGV